VSESGNGLHFNCVSLVQWVVQNTWSINYLPSCVFVISVSYE
jgi:hypothetical protein